MATTIGLGVQFTANASGMTKGLSEVDRQLKRLGQQASGVASLFDQFAGSSAAAAAAQKQVATDLALLNSTYKAGLVSGAEYAAGLKSIVTNATATAAAFAEGARITEQVATAEERRAATLARLDQLLEQGAISQQTYDRAAADASGSNEAAAKAEAERASALARAAQITQANLSPQQRYDQEVQELEQHLKAGRISQDTYNAAVAKAQQNLAKATAGTTGFGKEISRLEQRADSVTSALRVLAGIEIGRLAVDGVRLLANAFRNTVSSTADYVSAIAKTIDETNDLAQRTGVGVEALQSLQLAARLSGVNDLSGAMAKLSEAIGKAAESGKAEAFERLGLSFDKLQSLSPEQQFRTIGAAIAALPTEADRAAAAVAIFGRSGAELLPLFSQSTQELEERFKRLGIVISEDQVGAIADMNDALDIVSETFGGIIGQVAGNLAPLVTSIAEQFLSFVENFQGFESSGGTGIADALTLALLQGAEVLAQVFDSVVSYFSDFTVSMETVGGTFTRVGDVLTAIAEVFRGLFNIFELIGNGIAALLGSLLEKIGSFISSDLETFGKQFKENALKIGEQNANELNDAFTRAVRAGSDAVSGRQQQPAQQNAVGPAQALVNRLQQEFANRNSPDAQLDRQLRQLAREAEQRQNAAASKAAANAKRLADIEEKKQKKITDLTQRYTEKQKDIEADRLDALSRRSNEALQANDLRTSAGASQFLALATGREDPAVAEYRKQLQELIKIQREIRELRNEPVDILGG